MKSNDLQASYCKSTSLNLKGMQAYERLKKQISWYMMTI